MASSAANVSVGKPNVTAGAVYYKTGTVTPPTSTTTTLTGFIEVGYISEDGIKNSTSRETSDIKAWGGDIVLKPTTGFTDTFTFKMIESENIDVLKIAYGTSNVETTGSGSSVETSVEVNSSDLDKACWVFDIVLNSNKVKRIVIPNGQITEMSEITYKDSDPIGYEVTVTGYPDASGNTHCEYIK